MPQPVKLPDALINEAREAAEREHRSLAGQIEHWAELGRAVEADLVAPEMRAALTNASRVEPTAEGQRLADIFATALSDESQRTHAQELERRIVYGTDPAFPGWLVRIDANGRRTPGRLVNREFVPAEALLTQRHAAG
jgi:hypothetical protein